MITIIPCSTNKKIAYAITKLFQNKKIQCKTIESSITNFSDGEIFINFEKNTPEKITKCNQKNSSEETKKKNNQKANEYSENKQNQYLIIQSTYPPVHNHLIELFFTIEKITIDKGVKHRKHNQNITLIMPYLGYSRQIQSLKEEGKESTANSLQEQKQSRNSSTPLHLILKILQSLGVNRIITIDSHFYSRNHSVAKQNNSKNYQKFSEQKLNIINIDISKLFAEHLLQDNNLSQKIKSQNAIIISPDLGGQYKAKKIAKILNLDYILLNKQREDNGQCNIFYHYENTNKLNTIKNTEREKNHEEHNHRRNIKKIIEGKHCIIIDDIIDTGNTLCSCANFLTNNNALGISAVITHSVLSNEAIKNIEATAIQNIITSNTIPLHNKISSAKKEMQKRFTLIDISTIICEVLLKEALK